jgi:cysteine desulfurase
MGRHYLDHASTSPLRPEARDAMVGWLDASMAGTVADPGRIHVEGMTARVSLEHAREQVAAMLGARPREVVFTSGATESIAAAVWGALGAGAENDTRRHMVVPAVEHSAVRDASEAYTARVGGDVTVVGVDGLGRVDPDEVMAAVRPDTALVHVQWGNHEVGTIQPATEIAARCRRAGVLVHIDAAQAVGRVPIDFASTGADLLSLSGHKFGAPAGSGALLVRRGLRIEPLLRGGDQERARRAGIENLAAVLGLGAACQSLTVGNRLADEQATSRRQTDRVLAAVPGLDGVRTFGDPADRLPHLVCLGIDGIEPQAVLLGLDQAGIAAHSGSACASEGLEDSPVLEAMGVDAHRSLRISVGWSSTEADIDALLTTLPRVLERLRALGARAD